jgi:hypothetical protein
MTDIVNAIWIGLSIASVAYTAASAIANLTPTQKDDKAVEKVRKIFEFITNMVIPNLVATKKGIIKKN